MTPDSSFKADDTVAEVIPLKKNKSFVWLTLGGFISMLGDQFTLIALPWLALQLTGSALNLGLVLAIEAIPRAIFILIGGAIVDRYSPKRVLILSKYVSVLLLALLSYQVLTGSITMDYLYVYALAFGLFSAFALPAGTSILPFVVAEKQFEAANSMTMGLRQITMFLGPVTAGLIISQFGTTGAGTETETADLYGIGIIFGLDSLTFLIAALTLILVKTEKVDQKNTENTSVMTEVFTGIKYVWQDRSFRVLFLYIALVTTLIGGPVQVGLPVFADTVLSEGAAAYGTMISAVSFGALIGMVIAGTGVTLGFRSLGLMVLAADACAGLFLISLSLTNELTVAAMMLVVIGSIGGLVQIKAMTWIQKRTPKAMMGRIMSLLMFVGLGLAPLAAAGIGWLMTFISVTMLFQISGLVLASIAVLMMIFNQSMRRIGLESEEQKQTV